jgi:hypothetical protein
MPAPQILNLDELKMDVAESMSTLARQDGWYNIASGVGTSKDKRRYTTFKSNVLIPYQQLAAMYMDEGLIATIVDLFADDLTREWGRVENDPVDKDGLGIIATALEKLDAKSAFNTAEKWARLSGGSLIIIGALDGRAPETKLQVEKIRSIEYLKVIDIGDIVHSECEFNTDLASPNYGRIDSYVIQYRVGNQTVKRKVHSSRCIPFFGRKVPSGALGLPEINKYWGISEIQPVWPYLQDFSNAFGSISTVLAEYVIGKFKFSDLDEMLAEDSGKRFRARMEGIETTKSTINGIFLGTDEDYIRDTVSLSGVSDVLDRFMMNLASVTHYPVTKLFGRSATGLNATGENDQKNYYDSVRARQNSEWPYIQALVTMVASWKKVKIYTPFKWNPLFQLTDKEEADIDRIKAETYRTKADANQRYIQEGVLSPEDVYGVEFEAELGPKQPSYFEDLATANTEVVPLEDPEADPEEDPEEKKEPPK